jgi:hypothetical protein
MKIFVSACLAACALSAQTGKLQGPSSGFVFDGASQVLRRIQGIPGAAVIGPGLDFGFPVAGASVSPRLDAAIVFSADGVPHLFRVSGDAPVETAVAGLSAAEQVVFSPSGTAAALYANDSVQVVKGLPDAPTLGGAVTVHVRSKQQRPLAESLAISDDGAYLLYAGGGPVELIGVAGDSRQLTDGGPGALAAFAAGGHDAAVLHAGTLTVFRDVTGAATRSDVPGLSAPSAVAFAPDANTVFVASERARNVSAVDMGSGSITPLACDCAPTTLSRMGMLYRLNELSQSPLWLLDASAGPRLVFVPAKSGL